MTGFDWVTLGFHWFLLSLTWWFSGLKLVWLGFARFYRVWLGCVGWNRRGRRLERVAGWTRASRRASFQRRACGQCRGPPSRHTMTKSFTTVAAVHRVLVALTDFVSSLNNITHHSNVDLYRHSLFFFWKRNFNELGRTSPNSKLGYYVKRSFFLLFFFVFFRFFFTEDSPRGPPGSRSGVQKQIPALIALTGYGNRLADGRRR